MRLSRRFDRPRLPGSPYPGTALFGVCRGEDYLPADYLDRPADHRETILVLPGISQDDIDEITDRWTDIRAADTKRRYHDATAAANIAAIQEQAEFQASTG